MTSLSTLRLLTFPYRESRDGYWGDGSSTLNFCEEDYAVSHYCAEVFNTFSNAIFLWLGFKGIRNCVTNGHPLVFLLSFAAYILVGVGSIAFHTTNKYGMQLLDELSMIYSTCLMSFATFSYGHSGRFQLLLGTGLVGLAGLITGYYYKTRDPLFHQAAYGILTATSVAWSMFLMEANLRRDLGTRNPPRCEAMMREMWRLVTAGVGLFLTGYLLWNIDTIYCNNIRTWRHSVGLPWGAISEGHAWWHLLTGLGAYYLFVWGIWLRQCLRGRECEYRLFWPSYLTSVPEVLKTGLEEKQD